MSQLGIDMSTGSTTGRTGRGGLAALVSIVALVALVAVGVVFGMRLVGGGSNDYPGPGTGEATVQVLPGDSARDIGEALEAADVVKSADAFVEAAAAEEASRGLQPGFYLLKQQMSATGALDLMLDPSSRIMAQVTLPEGLRLTETLDRLAAGTQIPLAELTAAAQNGPAIGLPAYANNNAEGFLFPARYDIQPNDTATSVLSTLVARFGQSSEAVNLEGRAAGVGLTPYQALVVASLLEAEGHPEDFTKIARVVYNRLAAGMPLQFDSTVNYALNRDTVAVSLADLEVESPYNTYKYPGLPPGPIGSPGEQAMEAALSPAEGDWLYFVTVNPDTGETKFTASYDEFLQFKEELKANTGSG
ncbi:MAG: endolytic transglycosylase MltG [Candidatus Nanopelagicales bacterium]